MLVFLILILLLLRSLLSFFGLSSQYAIAESGSRQWREREKKKSQAPVLCARVCLSGFFFFSFYCSSSSVGGPRAHLHDSGLAQLFVK